METLKGLTDPDFEFKSIFVGLESLFRGYEGLDEYFAAVESAYERFEVVASRFFDAGAAVLIDCRIEWRGRESGAEGSMPMAVAAWVKAGRIFHLESYPVLDEGLRAVGLSEQEAHGDSV
jgi:hypothetical protein